ncbi:MAG TPA: DNA recombination protein RmuC [Ignavibacteria bacterium]|nr:DNA recombination protein RmuC [Bacteroidota bacterium]HRI84917.1 DNA recombination protein RmuC [Ignavibacteria bacterium]HRJ99570.1 DNA recombination protein RmuC [Ignavibacteria bacterium]
MCSLKYESDENSSAAPGMWVQIKIQTMDIVSILTGLAAGIIISYIIFYLLNKTNNVSKQDFDSLNEKFKEADTELKIFQDRLLTQQNENIKLSSRLESKESELSSLQSKSSALESNFLNSEKKLSELKITSDEQIKSVNSLQSEPILLKEKLAEEKANNNSLSENLKDQRAVNQKKDEIINQLTENLNKLTTENSALSANNKSLTEKLSTQKEEIIEIQKTSQLQFEKIANQILEEKSGKFTEANKSNIEALLKPLGENIDNFKKRVEETYDKESKQRFSLEEKVRELIEQTNKVSSEANNLANALKGQAKKQGNWGEMILESILQNSGLVKDREYFLQQTIKDDEGRNLRPDVLVKLPDNRLIIIDSKVSLVSYDKFSSAETPEEQSMHLKEHLKSVYRHIDDLQSKSYDNLEASLDFTMMFIPIEPAYLISIQTDQHLWSYAYKKRILLISPTNLIACLKLMANLWKRELQSKNAMEIVKRGELLYEKFVSFASALEEVGKHIDKSQESYSTAVKLLKSGSGHLVGQALKLKNLGLKSNKEIPPAFLPDDTETDNEAKQIE